MEKINGNKYFQDKGYTEKLDTVKPLKEERLLVYVSQI